MTAIHMARQLDLTTYLNINLLPNAVHDPKSDLRTTVAAAQRVGFPMDRIIFELTESEPVGDAVRLAATMREYRRLGLLTAIDDFKRWLPGPQPSGGACSLISSSSTSA